MDGKIGKANAELEEKLGSVNTDRFKSLLESSFTNDKSLIVDELNRFAIACKEKFELKSIYLEMNGFDINPDKWFFDFFGYDKYVDDEFELDWLSGWDSDNWPSITLIGLEDTQNDFDLYENQGGRSDSVAKEAKEYAVLLVMIKFALLIKESIDTGKINFHLPVLATAHDFEIIPRFFT